jgi:hypothetical protein
MSMTTMTADDKPLFAPKTVLLKSATVLAFSHQR